MQIWETIATSFLFFLKCESFGKAKAHFNLILKLLAAHQAWPISTKIYFDPGFLLIGLFFIPTKRAQFANSSTYVT